MHHQRHRCPDDSDCTEVSMMRYEDITTTIYEMKSPACGLGVDSLPDGMQMGFGMCLNDGDTEAGEGGQKGWIGWGACSIVYGKVSPACGLITMRVRQELAGVRPDQHPWRLGAWGDAGDLFASVDAG